MLQNQALGFPCGSDSKESTCNAGDLGSIPRLGRSPGEGKGYPLQYSGLENSMDCRVHGVIKSQTQLSLHFSWSEGDNRTLGKQKPGGQHLATRSTGRLLTAVGSNLL